jgi:hypothetical protein
MPPKIIAGEPGEAWVNTGPKVLFQCLVSWSNSCGSCVQYDHQIGPWWPLPRHRGCLCKNIPVPPGHEAEPFVDFQQEIAKLPPPQQARVIGVANWRLVESGTVPWGDVVTRTRIRPLKEVIARNELSVRDLTAAGVPRGRAASAWAAVHTPEREALAASRAEVVAKLRAGGLTADEIRREVAGRLAGRVGIGGGPSGGIGPVGPKPGPVVPPKPTPKPVVSATRVAAMEKVPVAPKAAPVAPADPIEARRRRVAERLATLPDELRRASEQESRLREEYDKHDTSTRKQSVVVARYHAEEELNRAIRERKGLEAQIQRLQSWETLRKDVPGLVPAGPIGDRIADYMAHGGGEKSRRLLDAVRPHSARLAELDARRGSIAVELSQGIDTEYKLTLQVGSAKGDKKAEYESQLDALRARQEGLFRERERVKQEAVEIKARRRDAIADVLAVGKKAAIRDNGNDPEMFLMGRMDRPAPTDRRTIDESITWLDRITHKGEADLGVAVGGRDAGPLPRQFQEVGQLHRPQAGRRSWRHRPRVGPPAGFPPETRRRPGGPAVAGVPRLSGRVRTHDGTPDPAPRGRIRPRREGTER